MPMELKLYQILEKAEIETKIAVEIQDWIVTFIDESRNKSMIQVEETKLLPMHQDLKKDLGLLRTDMEIQLTRMDDKIGSLRSDIDVRFNSLRSEMNLKFERVDEKFDSLRSEMDIRFARVDDKFDSLRTEMNGRFDYLIRFIALLAVPIIGSTIGGLGVIFLKIYETLR